MTFNEPVVQEMLDVYEDRLVQDGQNGQNGYNDAPALYLLLDDVPLFLRGMYNSYAAEVDPDLGYIFWEVQSRGYARDKTFEEAAFLERVRAMLVMEDGKNLWLARATPRAWLEQGEKISVRSAPPFSARRATKSSPTWTTATSPPLSKCLPAGRPRACCCGSGTRKPCRSRAFR